MQGVELNENFGTLGYLCNPSKPYTFSDLMKEVDAQRPVYAHARTRHGCILFGYTWIMDGYLRQSRTVTPFQPKPIDPGILEPVNPGILPPIEKEPTKVQIRNLVHCNLGNDGVGNGYYLSTVFNLGTGATIPDDDVRDGDRAQGQVEYEDGEITITTGIQPLRRVIIDPDLPIVEPNQPIEFGLSN